MLNPFLKYKKVMIFVIMGLFIAFLFWSISLEYHRDYTLGGTYQCVSPKFDFDSISFWGDGSNRFIYYQGMNQTVDKGTFKKISDGVYILDSPKLRGLKIVLYKKFPFESGFTTTIDEKTCVFKKVLNSPAIINTTQP